MTIAHKLIQVAMFGDLTNIKTGYIQQKKDRYVHVHIEDRVYVFGARSGVDKHGHLLLKGKISKASTEKYLRSKVASLNMAEVNMDTLIRISCILAADNPTLFTTGVLRYV